MTGTIGETWLKYKEAAKDFLELPTRHREVISGRFNLRPGAMSDDITQVRRSLFVAFSDSRSERLLDEILYFKTISN